jgi:hypothetical protein
MSAQRRGNAVASIRSDAPSTRRAYLQQLPRNAAAVAINLAASEAWEMMRSRDERAPT